MSVLLVDDETTILLSYKDILHHSGIKDVHILNDSRHVIPFLEKQNISVVVLDLFMPYVAGIEILSRIRLDFPEIPVVIMTSANYIETAVDCMKIGAFDYLVKPVEMNRFLSCLKRALEFRSLRDEISSVRNLIFSDELKHVDAFSVVVTRNKKMLKIFQYVEAIAPSNQPVLITGETGVGKELIAEVIHKLSQRKGRFIAVNIAGLDDTMFSDTLFGHKKGAFTGAMGNREGLIAQASGGTLFLDEIGDLSGSSQVKLLRLLQEHIYYSLGSDVPKHTDARIIVATNKDIRKADDFRKDLYYRLKTHHIHIPPLRERKEDIPLLLDYFLGEAAKSMGKKKPTPPPELINLLSIYDFHGNVREFQAMIYDAVARHRSGILSMESFKEVIKHEIPSQQTSLKLFGDEPVPLNAIFGHFPTAKEMEDFHMSEALRLAGGNQGIAASILGITRQTLNRRLKEDNAQKGVGL